MLPGKLRAALLVTATSAALAAAPASAADVTWRLSFGAEAATLLGGDRVEQVYGTVSPALSLGIDAELDDRWYAGVAATRGEASGTDLLAGSSPVPTTSRFRPTTLDLGFGAILAPSHRWRLLVGGGASGLHWREENDLLIREDSGWGAHLRLALRRARTPWTWGVGLRATWIPEALEDRAGTSRVVARQDYRAVAFGLFASQAFRGPGATQPDSPPSRPRGPRDWELRLAAGSVFATHTWRYALSPVAQQSADHDPYGALTLGLELPVAGPLGVALDLTYGSVDIASRSDYFNTGIVFVSSGASNAYLGALSLPVRVFERAGGDLRLAPLVAYQRYEVATAGGYTLEGTDQLWTAGLALVARIGRGPWGLHLALRHLALVRLDSTRAAFEFQPVDLQLGVAWRPGRLR